MKRFILILMLLINVIYIASYLINFDSFTLNKLWIVFFLISLCLSILFMFRSKKQSVLSIAAIVASISSLGAYGFQYVISNLMG
ncbi:hypothetical protein D1970_10585 [Mesobacillus zeae]|uniref:Uncharacterized protein n=1 Tax=Mesobacillus zeae TaxID=1917180 RepID=A0A398BBE1_9BACI|nr:hypothetical protein D1970_10585 [Mesobacillus zeae]